jgi:serine/threonine protein kinase
VINGNYSKECDVWSLGIAMYFALSLSYPFTAHTLKGLLNKIIQGQLVFKSKHIN